MFRARRWALDWLAAGVIGALVFAWFGHAFLNYDTFYAVVWGRDIANGWQPDYTVAVAPTPHPLAILIGLALTPFGAGAEGIMLAIGLLAVGMLVVGLFRLGQHLFGLWAGVLAAAIIATRVPILNYGIRGYVDLATAAFVVWGVVLEVRRPHRGTAVLILFGLAGLLRPEAWLYAGLYWFWLVTTAPDQSQRLKWTLLAAAAPLIWLASDLIVTGNPLHSLTGTHDLAAKLGRKTGLTALPAVGPRRIGEILRLPELLAAVIGLVFTFRWARDRAHVPLVILIANGVAYAAFAVAHLPLLGRYLFVAASMLSVFAGAGALGWLAEPPGHPSRRLWRPVGLAALLAIIVFFPLQQVDRLNVLKDDIANRARIQFDLKHLVQQPAVKNALHACARIYVETHRTVPLVELYADLPPGRVTEPARTAHGCAVAARTKQVESLAVLDPAEPQSVHGVIMRSPVQNRSWQFSRGATLIAGS